MVVGSTDVRKLCCNFIECALPQITSECEHIRFVDQRDVLTLALCCKFKCVPNTPLNAVPCIHTSLGCDFMRSTATQYAAFADIRPFGVFTNDNKIVRSHMARCSTDKRALVDIEVKVKTHLQKKSTLDNAGGDVRRADSPQQNGVKTAQLIQHVVGQDLAVAQVAHATQVEICGLDCHPSGAHHFHGLGRNFGTDSVSANECDAM